MTCSFIEGRMAGIRAWPTGERWWGYVRRRRNSSDSSNSSRRRRRRYDIVWARIGCEAMEVWITCTLEWGLTVERLLGLEPAPNTQRMTVLSDTSFTYYYDYYYYYYYYGCCWEASGSTHLDLTEPCVCQWSMTERFEHLAWWWLLNGSSAVDLTTTTTTTTTITTTAAAISTSTCMSCQHSSSASSVQPQLVVGTATIIAAISWATNNHHTCRGWSASTSTNCSSSGSGGSGSASTSSMQLQHPEAEVISSGPLMMAIDVPFHPYVMIRPHSLVVVGTSEREGEEAW